jgi:hypothetical protein
MHDLKKRQILLACTLNDSKGTRIAEPGTILTIGDDVSETVARQLLAGGSATLLARGPSSKTDEKEG